MSELDDRNVALELLSNIWSEVTHTSPPYYGTEYTEQQVLMALALLFERLGIDAKGYRQEASETKGGSAG